MAIQWAGSEQIELARAGIIFCYAVRHQGIRDLNLPLVKGLLVVLHADLHPYIRECALDVLIGCQTTYPHINVKLVLELLESVISWKDLEMRRRARGTVAHMLEAIVTDDQAFALANLNLKGMSRQEGRGNMDEAAVKLQKVIGVLSESNARR